MSYIITSAIATMEEALALEADPDFRRATPNMKLAFVAASRVAAHVPQGTERDRIALIVGTSFGELQATYDFFSGLALAKVARPLAFQNSLHHSTLGFLSRALRVTGPGFTVSREFFSGEAALELAMDSLALDADFAIAIGVDVTVAPLAELAARRVEAPATSGAAAVLLGREPGSPPGLKLGPIEYRTRESHEAPFAGGYDSDAVFAVASAREPVTLRLGKPDGSLSILRLDDANV